MIICIGWCEQKALKNWVLDKNVYILIKYNKIITFSYKMMDIQRDHAIFPNSNAFDQQYSHMIYERKFWAEKTYVFVKSTVPKYIGIQDIWPAHPLLNAKK